MTQRKVGPPVHWLIIGAIAIGTGVILAFALHVSFPG
jgi:hypothetical protein